MAIALVSGAHVIGNSTDSNGFTTGSVNSSGGDFAVQFLASDAAGTISDSKTNSYTGLTEISFADRARLYYALNAVVGSGHTFTVAGTSIFPSLAAAVFSGVDLSAPFDVENGAFGVGVTSQQAGSVTPTTNGQLILAAIGFDGNQTVSINSGFTILDQVGHSGFGFTGAALAYFIQPTAAAINPTWSWTGSDNVQAVIATFKAAAGGGGGGADQPTMWRWGGVPHMGGFNGFARRGGGGAWGKRESGVWVPNHLRRAA